MMSCGAKDGTVVYSHFEDIGSPGWNPADVISFEPFPSDSLINKNDRYKLVLVLRSSSRHDISPFPISVLKEDENGTLSSDTIMIDPQRNPEISEREQYGIREITMTIDPKMILTDGYAVSLSPLARQEHTKGLLNVGIIMKRQ